MFGSICATTFHTCERERERERACSISSSAITTAVMPRVLNVRFRMKGSWCRVHGVGLRMQGSWCRVCGAGFMG
jgi:hypothetical protein